MMLWIFAALFYVFKGVFFFFWDGFKTLGRLFWRRRPRKAYGDEICLITGAAQGLGRQLALELARRHAVVVLLDIQEGKLKEVADEVKEIGSKVYWYVCDCSNRESVCKVAARVKRTVGDVSILINNAGIVSGRTILESSEEEIEQIFRVNTLAHYWTVKALLPWMLENNYGYIVQVVSILGWCGLPRLGHYCASKAAAISTAESLRQELRAQKKTGISVTCVCPYHMDSTMFAGSTTSFPSLLPPLKLERVAERILQAMEEKQFMVALPKVMYLLPIVKSLVPTRTMDALLDFIGAKIDAINHPQIQPLTPSPRGKDKTA